MVSGTLAGRRAWSERVQFSWGPENTSPPLLYTSYWDDVLKISAGKVTFTKVGRVGELMEGVFEISNAGEYYSATESDDVKYTGVKSVRGYFTVMRTY